MIKKTISVQTPGWRLTQTGKYGIIIMLVSEFHLSEMLVYPIF